MQVLSRPDLPMWPVKTNFAAQISQAPYLCWLHQDDLWLPGRADAIRRWIAESPSAVLHLAPSVVVNDQGRHLGTWNCPLPSAGDVPARMLAERLIVQNFISAPAPVFRRDAWIATGGLDEALWYTADWDIWLKLAASGAVRYHSDPTTAFRVHGGSLTIVGGRDLVRLAEQMQIVIERHLPSVPDGSGLVKRLVSVSCAVNIALAAASGGNLRYLLGAIAGAILLGPKGWVRYCQDSRIVERLMPRLRAKFSGSL